MKGVRSMSVKIGSARIDENGKAHGGRAGDQTGKEVSTQSYYVHSKGWRVFRAKDPAAAGEAYAMVMKTTDIEAVGRAEKPEDMYESDINAYINMERFAAGKLI